MFKELLNLRLFDDGGDGGDKGDKGGDDGDKGNKNADGGGQKPDEKRPFAVFPDEQSFSARMQREGKKMFGEMLKGLGFDKEDDLKAVVTEYQTTKEKNKTDLEKAQAAVKTAEKEKTTALEQANRILKTSEAKLTANRLGVKAERTGYLVKLLDLDSIEVTDGKVDTDSLETSIKAILNDMPELKGTKQDSKGGQDFSGSNKKDLLTLEAIKAMSTDEAAERMDEIMAFMAKQKKK